MTMTRILATVSTIALTTAAGVSGANAYTLLFDLLPVPNLTAPTASASVVANEQDNASATISALANGNLIVIPVPPAAQDVNGGTISGLVSTNTIFSIAAGNVATDGYPGLKTEVQFDDAIPGNVVDLFTADGTANLAAATAGSLQANALSSIDAQTTNNEISAYFEDLGDGSSVTLEDNMITAEGSGNLATTRVAGDINPGLVGGEKGESTVTNPGGDELQAGATVLAATAQENVLLSKASALVDGARIGSLATVDGPMTSLLNSSLTVTGSEISALFTGNDAETSIIIDNDETLTLNGSAGVSSLQFSAGAVAYTASVLDAVIELGNSVPVTDVAVVDLDGSSLTFTDNEALAAVAVNQASNAVMLDSGINLVGPSVAADQANTFTSGAPDVADVGADLFIQNVQYSQVDASALDQADLNVLVEDLLDTGTVLVESNAVGSLATGNAALSFIEVVKATTFDSLVAVQSVQYAEGTQTATTGDGADGANLLVSLATLNAGGIIANSSVTTQDNSLSSKAVGNDSETFISIESGDVAGQVTGSTLRANRTTTSGENPTDISLVNAQVLDGGGAQATTFSNIRVNAALNGGVASIIDTASIVTSDNEISALAIGNLSREASIDITATTVDATVGVINSQTVEDGALLTAGTDSPNPFTGQLQVWAFPNQIVDSKIKTDNNTFSATVYGNLADETTTSLTVKANEISSPAEFPYVRVDRSGTTTDTKVSGGLVVLSDQSVEDLEGAVVTAQSGEIVDPNGQGDLIYVRVGLSNQLPMVNANFTVDENQGTVAATLNQATTKLTVDAATKLDSPSALVNVQSVADDDNDGSSAALVADQYDADITMSVGTAGDGSPASIQDSSFSIDGNDLLASGRVNLATNTASIEAQTQLLTTTEASAYAVLFDQNVDWVNANAESMLINDQVFTNLGDTGAGDSLSVINDNSDLDLIIGTTGAFTANKATIAGNTMTVQALGNDATNSLSLNVQNFDLSKASSGGAAHNGPIAVLASNQVGEVVGQGANLGLSADGITLRAIIDLNDVTGAIGGSTIGIDDNEFLVHAEVNNVVNTLSAAGNTLPDVQGVTTPTADVGDTTLSFPIAFSPSTTFGLASRQVNGLDVTATLEGNGAGTPAGLRIDADNTPTIDATALSISENTFSSEARGSDSINALSLDYNTNNAQAFLANAQSVGGTDPVISAVTFDVEILMDLDEDTVAPNPPTLTKTSVDLSGNTIAALASSNRTANLVEIDGTDIYSGSDAAPGVLVQNPLAGPVLGPAGANPLIRVTGDLGLVNLQGSAGNLNAIPNGEDVTSEVEQVRIVANIDTFDTGSLSIDNNLVLSQAVVHSAGDANLTGDPATAGNIMLIRADAAIGEVDNALGASVVSVQTLALDTDASASVSTVAIGAFDTFAGSIGGIDDVSDPGSVSVSASKNAVAAVATGATAVNALGVTAGASITGGTVARAPVIGFPGANDTTLNADFNLLNVQVGFSDGGTIKADTSDVAIGYQLGSALSGDALKVVQNLILAQARGFSARNVVSLSADASSDATAQIGNVQALNDIGISATADNTGHGLDIAGGALNSSVSVLSNAINASAAGNIASNELSTKADASLQETSGAGATLDPGAVSQIAATAVDYAVLNRQSLSDSTVSSTITDALIGVDDLGPAGFNTTSVSVEGNEVLASATGNDATNSLVLNTGTFQHPSAAVASLQTTSGATISASVSGVVIGIGSSSTLAGTSNGSSFSVSGNSVGAVAIGSSAVNRITSD